MKSYLGRYAIAGEEETARRVGALKRSAWRRDGVLVVDARDPNLTWPERELVKQLGCRLYGARPTDAKRRGDG